MSRPRQHFSALDEVLLRADGVLRALTRTGMRQRRPSPALDVDDTATLAPEERRLSAALMRVNHAGEVCAQALYVGQAIFTREPQTRETLLCAASEESDHLFWCEERLSELDDRPSRLNPVWFTGSLAIGAVAGLAGDRLNLGFVEETERQVVEHLQSHLKRLPERDRRSRAVVRAMQKDEARHADTAVAQGARSLPWLMRSLMRLHARVMTTVAHRV